MAFWKEEKITKIERKKGERTRLLIFDF